jgi:hypothetical protein
VKPLHEDVALSTPSCYKTGVTVRAAIRPTETKRRPAVKAQGVEKPKPVVSEAAAPEGDAFEKSDDDAQKKRGWWQRVTHPQISTKKAAHASSVFIAGLEVAVKVNHVDPLNDGRRDVKGNWVADGENLAVDLESVLLRRNLPKGMRFELQGPALQAKADGETLPLRARFIGVGVTKDVSGDMPHDDTPPRAEVKVEVKLTDRSIGSLAGLAGATAELKTLLTDIEGTAAAQTIGEVLLMAVPVISTGVAIVSARRALKTLRDATAPLANKALAVARALADATTIFFPLIGTLANLALVGAAVAVAHHDAKRAGTAGPATDPPS